MEPIHLILCDIRSTHNVGSILRTADAVGVKTVYICGVTPAPIDRFGRKRADIAKVALGAEESVRWIEAGDVQKTIRTLKTAGVTIVAVEQDARSVPHHTFAATGPTAFVFGEETKGIPKHILNECDCIVEVPMRGKKESLNVAVTAGIVLFRCTEKTT